MNLLTRLRIALLRLLIRTAGRLSDGIRLCLHQGLTAGKTVDYIYRNTPSGITPLGRWIDRQFLAHPGWAAVRARRANLEGLILEAVETLRGQDRAIALVDIASGPAAYVLAVLERAGGEDITALCRDLDERWLDEGRAEARRRGITRVRFEHGDAFDREQLAAITPAPNLFVASGFYDWIGDDETVQHSFEVLSEILPPGGQFVLTNQTAHPDLAMVSGVFSGFDQRPLDMKMRPVAQIEAWLNAAGLTVEHTLSDEGGYYSVTRASKAV